MKIPRIWRFVLILLVFTISFYSISAIEDETLTINSPNYFGEQAKIYDEIHYIEEEHLSFKFCSAAEVKNKKFKLTCNDNNNARELITMQDKRDPKCYYSNFDLLYSPCDDFKLELNYEVNNKQKQITRTFKKQKQSKLLNHIINLDYTKLNSIDLSYYLIVLNNIIPLSSKKSIDVYETIKNQRNNDNKCWPTESCTINETSRILRNIKLAQYSLNTRLLEDGKTFLEKMMISNTNNPLQFIIKVDNTYAGSEKISCSLTVDTDSPKTYLFDANTTTIQKYASSSFGFTCNQTVDKITFLLSNLNNKTQDFATYENTNKFSYTIDSFGCIGETTLCDFDSTINTLISYENSLQNSNLLNSYINSLIVKDPSETYLDTDNKYEDIGKVLFYNKNVDLLEYLKFHQNNDGSWGEDSRYEKIIQTAWAILGLQKSGASDEYINDGEKWIYYNEPLNGWGTTEKNTLAYLAIKEQIKPFLKITPYNVIKDNTVFKISNPTIHNIKNVQIQFSKEINEFLSYKQDIGDIESEEEITLNVTLASTYYGQATGDMIITGLDGKNNKIELIKMPITISGPMPFKLESGKYSMSEELKAVQVKIIQQIKTYTSQCEYTSPFDNSLQKISIDQSAKTFNIPNPSLKSGNFSFDVKCTYDENEFIIPLELNLEIAKKTFELKQNEITLTDFNDFSIELTSIHDDKQTVTISVDGHYDGLVKPAETSKIIAKADVRELFFTIENPVFLEALGNSSKGNIIIQSDSGYSKVIPIKVNIGGKKETGQNPYLKWYVSIGILLLLIISVVLYRYYQLNNDENMQESQDDEYYIE